MGKWSYDAWPSGEPYAWGDTSRGTSAFDNIDFHVDLGCGRLKKGRIGVDRWPAPGVNVVMDLDKLRVYATTAVPGEDAPAGHVHHGDQLLTMSTGLPFGDHSIESIVSHHALEHIGDGFIGLIDECYRVLKPGGLFRIIVPLFPSWNAVSDPDHKRYFMAWPDGPSTFDAFCGTPGDTPQNCWQASFSVPYCNARFEKVDQQLTAWVPVEKQWGPEDARELRIALRAMK